VTPGSLFYVLRGAVSIEKSGRQFAVEARTFIGEVAFLHNTPASATVVLEPGARYLEWPVGSLQRKIGRRHSLNHSVLRLIGLDMALKIARS
jgi:CRP-like cAMP-binding protein